MAAIITDKLKKQVLESIITDIDSSDNNYYIGVGRSEVWNVSDTATNDQRILYGKLETLVFLYSQ